MPQLGPLPWLLFFIISFFPMIFVVLISEMVFNSIEFGSDSVVNTLLLKW